MTTTFYLCKISVREMGRRGQEWKPVRWQLAVSQVSGEGSLDVRDSFVQWYRIRLSGFDFPHLQNGDNNKVGKNKLNGLLVSAPT